MPHDTAHDLLQRGFYIFPVSGKMPLIRWTKESSNDPVQIKSWENLRGRTGWGIDCGKSDLAVLDIDSGKVSSASDSLFDLELEHGELPTTLTVRTPTGGFHRIYRGAIKNSASSKLGAGLDTRGAGGFIVAPGSPGYEITDDQPICEVPQWLVGLVGRPAERTETPTPENVDVDSDTAIRLATAYLHNAEPAIEGLGGDLHTFKVACGVRDYGVSKDKAFDLMLDIWNDTCSPPWPPEELEAKISNAYAYAVQPIGNNNPENVFDQYEDTEAPATTKITRPLFIDAHDLIRHELTIDYLIQGLIETPTTGLIFGDPGAGKSFLAMSMAMGVAFGTDWMGSMAAQGPALYFNGEGHVGAARRIKAWLKHRGYEDIPQGLFTLTQRRVELTEQSVMKLEPLIKQIVDKYGPLSLITVDTLARHLASDADENSAKDVGGFINAVDYLKDRFHCTVAVVHHSGKQNKESSRGSSAIKGALDWEFKVAPGELKFTKQKEGELPMPMGFRLETVEIGEGVVSAVPVPSEYDPTGGKMRGLSVRDVMALESLKMEISLSGEKGVTQESWRKAFKMQLESDLSKQAKTNACQKAEERLVHSGVVKFENGLFSLVQPSSEDYPF